MESTNNIVVDLTKPLGEEQADANTFFQYRAKNRLEELLKSIKVPQSADSDRNNSNDPKAKWEAEFTRKRVNNTIFISGQRGAGKTTFLQAVMLERLNEDDQIFPLALIDPTLVETHQHILVDIVAKFSELIKNQLACCGDDKKYRQFNQRLEAMAEGLNLLKSQGQGPEQDAAWFLNKALKHAVSGQNLEAKFHALIDEAASSLGQSLFLIAFDDVDTDTSKAYDVLELIRKYLNHPKLAVLITGDLTLYSHIVKNKKLEEFKGNKDDATTHALVEHLEQQYLVKILPIEQRINLKNLQELSLDTKKGSKSFLVKTSSENPQDLQKKLQEHVDELLCSGLNVRDKHIAVYRRFLLTLPVRSTLQILKSCDKDATGNALSYLLSNSYVGALLKEKVEVEALLSTNPHPNAIGLALFNVCEKNGELETGFYARPDSNLESYNAAQIFISSVIADYLSASNNTLNIGRALQLMLTGGAACNVYMNYVANHLKDGCTAKDFIHYIGLHKAQNAFGLAAHFSPLLMPDNSGSNKVTKQMHSGVMRMPRNKPTNFSREKFKSMLTSKGGDKAERITTLRSFEKLSHSVASLAEYIASTTVLLSAHSVQTAAEGRDYISIYCLLAAIADMLASPVDSIEDITRKMMALPTYGSPSFLADNKGGGEDFEEDDIDDVGEESTDSFAYDDSFFVLMKSWRESCNTGNFSALLVGKVWSRVMYTMESVSEKEKRKVSKKDEGKTKNAKDVTLFEMMQRSIWGLINACLIEEVRYGYLSSESADNNAKIIDSLKSAKNVATAPNELITNFKSVIGALNDESSSKYLQFKKTFPLTSALISCPLLWPYLTNLQTADDNTLLGKPFEFFTFDENKQFFSDDIKSDIKKADLFVSRLPIMGCFVDDNKKDKAT